MTTLEALVSMAQTVLRAKGQWQGGATAYAEIDEAVNGCADLLRGGAEPHIEISVGIVNMVIAELKRRAGVAK